MSMKIGQEVTYRGLGGTLEDGGDGCDEGADYYAQVCRVGDDGTVDLNIYDQVEGEFALPNGQRVPIPLRALRRGLPNAAHSPTPLPGFWR